MTRAKIVAGKTVIVIEAVDRIDKALAGIRNKLHKFANVTSAAGEQLFRGGFFGGIASGLILTQFAKFDDLMLELRTKLDLYGSSAGHVDQVMSRLEMRIRNLGKTTSFTSKEVAAAAIELAKGGLGVGEIENSLQAILDLGRGTRASLDEAAKMYVRTMRTFNIQSDQANEIVSQFVRATRKGTLGIDDLEASLRYASGTAATLEQNLSPILALFAQLSNRGLAGSIGGTSLNTAMANLIKKMKDLQDVFPGFNPVYNQNGFDLLMTLNELFKATNKLSNLERITVFQDVFNLRGARAIAGAQDIKRIIQLSQEIKTAGNEGRIAAQIMDSGLGGAWRRAMSAAQEFFLSLGDGTEKYLIPTLNAIRSIINELSAFTAVNPNIAAAIVLSPAALLAAGAALLAISKASRLAAFGVGGLQDVYRSLTRFIGRATSQQLIFVKSLLQTKAATKTLAKTTAKAKRNPLDVLGKPRAPVKAPGRIAKNFPTLTKVAKSARLASAVKTVATLGTRLLSVAKIVTRFTFSLGGLITILELLFSFTSLGSKLVAGFSGAFKALGMTVKLAQGPMELFRVAFAALTKGQGKLGVAALVEGFKSLATIIGSQITAAWNRFKEGLGEAWTIGSQIVMVITEVFNLIVGLGKVSLANLFGNLGIQLQAVMDVFSPNSGSMSSALMGIMQAALKYTGFLVSATTAMVISIRSIYNDFLLRLESVFFKIIDAMWMGQSDVISSRLEKIEDLREKNRERRQTDLDGVTKTNNAFQNGITKAFELGATQIANSQRAQAARRASEAESIRARMQARYMAQFVTGSNGIDPQRQGKAIPNQYNTPQEVAKSAKAMRLVASALVGSAASTRGNLLKNGSNIDKKQLDVLKDIRDNQEKGLSNAGDITFKR